MPAIHFESKIVRIGPCTLLVLPEEASVQLPSRGIVMVSGMLNETKILTPLEPDGKGSHWLKLNEELLRAAGAKTGDTVKLEIESTKDWTEPEVPDDWKDALEGSPKARALWEEITPMARWDWVRWMGATNKGETRAKHIRVGISKLNSGMRRPCCFNRSACTVPEVSKGGKLLDPNP